MSTYTSACTLGGQTDRQTFIPVISLTTKVEDEEGVHTGDERGEVGQRRMPEIEFTKLFFIKTLHVLLI